MYYKGNNIGLNYDAATGTWAFSNEPQDFIDKSAFSTPDPVFEYATPPTDEDGEEDTNCPEGYVYDNTLKQCIPDPSIQNQYSQQNQGGGQDAPAVQIAGTNRTTADSNFIASDDEYAKMSAGELIENLKQRGFMEKDESGNLVINLERGSIGSSVIDNLFGKASSTKLNTHRNKQQKIISLLIDKGIINQMNAYPQGGISATDPNADSMKTKFVIPTIKKFEADYYNIPTSNVIAPGFGDSIYGTKKSVQKFDSFMQAKIDSFKVVANNSIKNYSNDGYSARRDSLNAYKEAQEVEKRNKKAENRRKEADALAAEIKAEKESVNLARLKVENRRKENMQQTIRQAETKQQKKDEYRDTGQTTYNTKDTGGYVTIPNKPSAPPGEKGGGGYIKPKKTKTTKPKKSFNIHG